MKLFRRRYYVVLMGQPGGEFSWARPYWRKATAERRAERMNRHAVHPYMAYAVVKSLDLPEGRL